MALDITRANSVNQLYKEATAEEREVLAKLALKIVSLIGASESWDDLPDLVETVAQRARHDLGLIVSDQGADEAQPHWQRISPWS